MEARDMPAAARLITMIDRYTDPSVPTFDDVRWAAELAELEENGGRPAPLPRFGDVLAAHCEKTHISRDESRWLLARLPDAISVEAAGAFELGDLSDRDWLELAWRLPPAARSRVGGGDGFVSDARAPLLALLGPGPPDARRALCASILADHGTYGAHASLSAIARVLVCMLHPSATPLAMTAVGGPAGARRACGARGVAPNEAVAELKFDLYDYLDIGGPTSRGRLSAREFIRRRGFAAAANAARYVRWRAAATAAACSLGRRGGAALRLGGYAHHEYGSDSD